ncbi:hypothetical protein [Arthrobacter psychrolactophilus]
MKHQMLSVWISPCSPRMGSQRISGGDLITSMSGQIDDADQNLRDAYSGLYREIDHDAEAWFVVAEAFAQACIDNNWRGLRDAPAKTYSGPLALR